MTVSSLVVMFLIVFLLHSACEAARPQQSEKRGDVVSDGDGGRESADEEIQSALAAMDAVVHKYQAPAHQTQKSTASSVKPRRAFGTQLRRAHHRHWHGRRLGRSNRDRHDEAGDVQEPLYTQFQQALAESARDARELGKRHRSLAESIRKHRDWQGSDTQLHTGSSFEPSAGRPLSDSIHIYLPATTTFTVVVLFSSVIAVVVSISSVVTQGTDLAHLVPWMRWDTYAVALFVAYLCLSVSFKFFVSSMRTSYSPTYFLTLVSLAKLIMSLGLFRYRDGTFSELVGIAERHTVCLVAYIAPSALYTASDLLTILCLRRLDPVAVALLSQVRNLVVSLMWQVMFKKKLGSGQNIGIFMVCLGMFTKELSHAKSFVSDLEFQGSRLEAYALCCLCLACNSAGALWGEKMLKENQIPINVQNVSFCTFSAAFAWISHATYLRFYIGVSLLPLASAPSERILYACAVLAMSAFGLVSASFVRDFGNVLRVLGNTFIISMCVPLQWAVLGYDFTFSECAGIVVSLLGIVMFSMLDPEVVSNILPQKSARSAKETRLPIWMLQHDDILRLNISALDLIDTCRKQVSIDATDQDTGFSCKPTLLTGSLHSHSGSGVSVQSFQLLVDHALEAPVAVLDDTWIAAMRTGVLTSITICDLATKHWHVIAFYGLGNVARGTLLCLLEQADDPIVVRLVKSDGQETLFHERFASNGRITWEEYDTPSSAFSGADIIVMTTDIVPSAVLRAGMLKPGVLVLALREQDQQHHSKSITNLFHDAQEEDGMRKQAGFREYTADAELRSIWTEAIGRNADWERIFVHIHDCVSCDVVICSYAYDVARTRGKSGHASVAFFTKRWI